MYNMFHPLHSLIKYTYVTFIFSFTPASGRYIGEISKSAPTSVKIILFQLAIYGPQSKFWFPPSFHSNLLLITYLVLTIGYWSHGIFGKFQRWPCFVHQVMSHVWSNGKFPIFLFLFGTLAVKAMAFWEILLSSHQNLLFLKHVKISLIF